MTRPASLEARSHDSLVNDALAMPDSDRSRQRGTGSELTRREIESGLTAACAHISPKYFYDGLGSRLFEAITDLPEYYPTRTEQSIFRNHAANIARSVGTDATLIDLGAGNCEKAASLFDALRPAQYVAIDISADFLDNALGALRTRFPDIRMLGLGVDFSSGLALPDAVRAEKRLFFYPGSSIGNFPPLSALALLKDLRRQAGADGGLLIGFDLVKDIGVLEAAYDDALGVTAAFNRNLLLNLNALIGANFDVRDWRHRAFYNQRLSRIEMHLEAQCDVDVDWQDGSRHFRASERIHTESSYKYQVPEFHALLEQAGFMPRHTWTDENDWFALCHAECHVEGHFGSHVQGQGKTWPDRT